MIHRKASVRFGGLKPELVLAIMIARDIYAQYHEDFRFTSVVDGEHGAVSYHRAGYGMDFNAPGKQSVTIHILRDLKQKLGPEFDVVVEPDHWHVEFDVRRQGEYK